MNKLLIRILFLVLIFSGNSLFAQVNDIRFRQISPPGGFTLDGLKTIVQDDLGYMWMATNQGLLKYDSNTRKWFVPSIKDSLSLPSREIRDLCCDANNQLWIATNQGLCIFVREKQNFNQVNYTYEDGSKSSEKVLSILKQENEDLLLIDESSFGILNLQTNQLARIGKDQISSPSKLYQDNSNRIWIGTVHGDIFRYFPKKNTVVKIISCKAKINSIYTENKQIWVGTEGEGANIYNLDGDFIKQISFSCDGVNYTPANVRKIKKDTYGRYWFGTYEGLFMDDGNELTRFKPDDYPGLPHNSIYEIYEDKQGGIWFGTWSGGVALVHHSDNNFKTFRHSPSRNSISSNLVSSFVQSTKNELLIGTEVGGLNSFDLTTEKFDIIQLTENAEISIKTLCKDKQGGIWVGTFRKGLWYRPAGSTEFKHFEKGPDDGKHISSVSVYSLCAVDSGVWIGTFHNGINFYNFNTQTIRHCFLNNSNNIPMSTLVVNSILADSDSNLWLGTFLGVLYKIHLPSGNITQYSTEEIINQSENHSIYYLWQHSSGNIWCGTPNRGLLLFNPDSSRFDSFDTDGHLNQETVFGIVEDKNKKIWITSNNGLLLYNPEDNTKRHFAYSDGLQSDLFMPRAVYKDTKEDLYFGGTNGFTKINPNVIKLNSRKPFTIINSVTTKDNKSIFPIHSDKYNIVPIQLEPGETTFRINFSADNYLMPEKNKYKYRLTNYYDDWIDNENEGSVLFTSLHAGEYIFEVKACNNDGIWSDTPTRISIEIRNYWFRTNFAYLLYILLLSALFYFIGRFYFERLKLKRAVALEKNQRENEEQIHEMKLKFFTNISHEFRTPLTLISWPVKRLLNADNITDEQREELEVANRNSNRLLQLINQIIDLRKLEKEKSKLNISKIDIIDFIKQMQHDFSLEAKSQEINFSIESPHSSLEIEADREKLETILYNLLANAYKYVSIKGKITITVDNKISNETNAYSNLLSFGEIHVDNFIEIAIEDTGTGIDNEDLFKIFTRFEQGKQNNKKNSKRIKGSGIGLAMCKDYTLLHHGKITAQSSLGKGSRFTIVIPAKQKAQKVLFESHQKIKNLTINESLSIQPIKEKGSEYKNRILVVEDNPDFSKFVINYLSQYYLVNSAANGNEALKILKNQNIDLIVSDVMMPKMDGFELCSIVKTQIETSHIPVILLTALSSSENLITGLDKGADAYLTKPFDENVLVKQIENILEQRKRIHENFSKKFISQKPVEVSSLDNFFLNKVRDVIEKNLSDESFSMDKLAEELMISRSKLHRKIKSLSGITTSEFVNLVRIKKAVELITQENYLFSEVAFQVGFSSQSYFNRCFKKVYNVTPKEYFAKETK